MNTRPTTKALRVWNWLCGAAADATRPGHLARVTQGADLLLGQMRAQRGRFELVPAAATIGLHEVEIHDASVAAYRRLCEQAAADGTITCVERATLEWAARKLALTDEDVRSTHDVVQMPPWLDMLTGELVPFPHGRAARALHTAARAGRAIGATTAVVARGGAQSIVRIVPRRGPTRAPESNGQPEAPPPAPSGIPSQRLSLPCVPRADGLDHGVRTVRIEGPMAGFMDHFVTAAKRRQSVLLVYRKTETERPTRRVIEPFEGLYFEGVVMVRCWQRIPTLPHPSWRTFRLDRFDTCSLSGEAFQAVQDPPLAQGRLRAWGPDEVEW